MENKIKERELREFKRQREQEMDDFLDNMFQVDEE